jgi:probable phosphoglycerate mutase
MRVDFQRPFSAPSGAQEVVLVRHGAVTQPPAGDQQGPIGRQNDPPLDERGRDQAAAVARRLAEEPIGGVFLSPLRRATETAQPLLARWPGRPEMLDDLREVELGDWEHGELSRRAAVGDPHFVRVMLEQRWDLIPNAEPASEFATRVLRGLRDAASTSGPDTVAVVYTHSGVIAEACRQITGSRPFAFLNASNGSLTRVVHMPDGRWVLVSFNETAHLPPQWQPRRQRPG